MDVMSTPLFSLRKSRHVLRTSFSVYKQKRKNLSPSQLQTFERLLGDLDKALLDKEREKADSLARDVELFIKQHIPKTLLSHLKELAIALVFALVVATLVRQMWFEPYTIPTGSMRPTFEEQDHLLVSKTNFGLNIPLSTGHFFFNPALVQREGIFVFTVENMAVDNSDTTYFYLFPGKKRFIKRNMGKPGDSLYFYGGKLYGVDVNGQAITDLSNNPSLSKIEHIPFLTFEGRVSAPGETASGISTSVFLNQMNIPIGKLQLGLKGATTTGEFLKDGRWAAESSKPENAISENPSEPQAFGDLWGMKNYGMARLLSRKELINFTPTASHPAESKETPAILYLEIRHDPGTTYPAPQVSMDEHGRIRPSLTPYVSMIPLDASHVQAIMENMYTTRFVVKNGRAVRYQDEESSPTPDSMAPAFPGVPDGCYEFYYGVAYSIGTGSIATPLPKDHPLYKPTPENIQNLFNVGIEFLTLTQPSSPRQNYFPRRYAYFRDGDLYLLGAPILSKEEPVLRAFVEEELRRNQNSKVGQPYRPFIDHGAPLLKDGTLDKEFIQTFGLKIPEKMYLALGDNHAISGDSREFGFVPEENIQGGASAILWPPGPRFGAPNQKGYPWITPANFIIYGFIVAIVAGWISYRKNSDTRPLFRKISKKD